MKFSDFDKKMREYENSIDTKITKGNYIVVRLDGRNFHKLVKKYKYDRPFDSRFRDRMIEVVKNLMLNSGFNIRYGYTQSDEISLLLAFNEDTYNRKPRKLNSILASLASVYFNGNYTNIIDMLGVFDSRVIPLPNSELVQDYFRWRQEDCNRNCLESLCYWNLRNLGYSKHEASNKLLNTNTSTKNEILFSIGINYNDIELWQKRGIGLYFDWYSSTNSIGKKRILQVDMNLTIKDEYYEFVKRFCY